MVDLEGFYCEHHNVSIRLCYYLLALHLSALAYCVHLFDAASGAELLILLPLSITILVVSLAIGVILQFRERALLGKIIDLSDQDITDPQFHFRTEALKKKYEPTDKCILHIHWVLLVLAIVAMAVFKYINAVRNCPLFLLCD